MKSIKVYYYGFIILLSLVGFAVLVILIFWASKFKRHWFGPTKEKEVRASKSDKKRKKEEVKSEKLDSSD